MQLLRNNLRIDGRSLYELRNIEINYGLVECQPFLELSFGGTVIKSTFKRKYDQKQTIRTNIIFFESTQKHGKQYHGEIEEIKKRINDIFDHVITNRNDKIEVEIIIKQDNGSLLSTIINCVSLLFCYGGINLNDIVVSVSAVIKDNKPLIDSCEYEEEHNLTRFILAYSPSKDKVNMLIIDNKLQEKFLKEIYNTVKLAAIQIYNCFEIFLKSKVANDRFEITKFSCIKLNI